MASSSSNMRCTVRSSSRAGPVSTCNACMLVVGWFAFPQMMIVNRTIVLVSMTCDGCCVPTKQQGVMDAINGMARDGVCHSSHDTAMYC